MEMANDGIQEEESFSFLPTPYLVPQKWHNNNNINNEENGKKKIFIEEGKGS
jgi:hypothetical protein